MKKIYLQALLFIVSLGAVGQQLEKKNNKPPNILIITVDNVGYGDFSIYNKKSPIITPNIERLAKEGVRLTNFYTASPTCQQRSP